VTSTKENLRFSGTDISLTLKLGADLLPRGRLVGAESFVAMAGGPVRRTWTKEDFREAEELRRDLAAARRYADQ